MNVDAKIRNDTNIGNENRPLGPVDENVAVEIADSAAGGSTTPGPTVTSMGTVSERTLIRPTSLVKIVHEVALSQQTEKPPSETTGLLLV